MVSKKLTKEAHKEVMNKLHGETKKEYFIDIDLNENVVAYSEKEAFKIAKRRIKNMDYSLQIGDVQEIKDE